MSQKQTSWIFMGSDAIALPVLDFLYNRPELKLEAVFTQPDRPHGRGKKVSPNPIKLWAEAHKLPIFQPEKLQQEDRNYLEENKIEWALVMAYGLYIPRTFIAHFPLKIHNLHSSILPKYRGASPIETAIAEGDTETGTSLMEIIPEMDAGPVLDIERICIENSDTGPTLREKIATSCIPLVERSLEAITAGKTTPTPQNDSEATFARKLTKEDGWLDFSKPAFVLENRIRAFSAWPGAFCELAGTRIKIGSAKTLERDAKPGVIFYQDDALCVGTGAESLELLSLQKPGGKMLPVAEFLRGFPIPEGTRLSGKETPPLVTK